MCLPNNLSAEVHNSEGLLIPWESMQKYYLYEHISRGKKYTKMYLTLLVTKEKWIKTIW